MENLSNSKRTCGIYGNNIFGNIHNLQENIVSSDIVKTENDSEKEFRKSNIELGHIESSSKVKIKCEIEDEPFENSEDIVEYHEISNNVDDILCLLFTWLFGPINPTLAL